MTARASLIAFALWLAIGLGIKHLRYSEPFALEVVTAEETLSRYLAQQGWQVVDRITLGKDQRYGTLIARRPYCADPVAVMLIDTSDSISELFERSVQGNVAYIENGDRYSSPPAARLLMRTMVNSVSSAFGLHAAPAFPILAVAPAKAADDGLCGIAIERNWSTFQDAAKPLPKS